LAFDAHQPALDEPKAHAPGTEALGIKDVLQFHRDGLFHPLRPAGWR
jgi:hypothetical protein